MSFPAALITLLGISALSSMSVHGGQMIKDEKTGEVVEAVYQNETVSAAELKTLAGKKRLTDLQLGDAPEGVVIEKGALSALADCPLLENLWIAKEDLRDEDLEVLPKIKALKSLTIQASDLVGIGNKHGLTDKAIESLAALPNLEGLRIWGRGNYSDDSLQKLLTLPKLTSLEIFSNRFSDRALIAAADNPRLKILALHSPNFTDAGMQTLRQMHALEELQIDSPLLTKQSLHAVAPLKGLRVLDLPIADIDRESLAVVAGLPALKCLILRSAPVDDWMFEVLEGHPALQALFLEKSKLTEKSDRILKSLKKLEYGRITPLKSFGIDKP
jgi:hypothetical protein